MQNEAVQSAFAVCALDVLAIGVIVTDSQARRLYANAAADRLLNDPAGALNCSSDGRISASRHEARHDLQSLISLACGGDAWPRRVATSPRWIDKSDRPDRALSAGNYILLSCPDRIGANLAVRILPMGSTGPILGAFDRNETNCRTNAVLLLRPIERDCNLEIEAERLLGLSRAEARLASGLGAGLSLQEVADAQGVTLATARSHLKSIYRKTSLNRQSQLVALLRSTQIPIEAAERPPAKVEAARLSRGVPA